MKDIDEIKSKNNKYCFGCGVELYEEITSRWQVFGKDGNTHKKCVMCTAIDRRMLNGGGIIVGNEIIPKKTREECILEIKGEGLFSEILKAIEEKEVCDKIM